ncbi:MAG TPA: DUF4190 domain-containing protein [Terriglobales bacterium]|nr:DUF4190 domain-containing protein [Terriglobales bacterium]
MFCPGCGATKTDGSNFCSTCGMTILSASSPQSALASPKTNGTSIASLIFGCFAFLFPSAILAIIFGHLSISEIRKSGGRLQGKGIAITGLVFGYLGIAMIPLILIIAAIAIPNLLRARISANESSAITSIRTLAAAEHTYASGHLSTGYACFLSDLKDRIDPKLTTGQNHGYAFQVYGCTPDSSGLLHTKYQIVAYPLGRDQTGVRAFCVDESALIRVDDGGSARECLRNATLLQ